MRRWRGALIGVTAGQAAVRSAVSYEQANVVVCWAAESGCVGDGGLERGCPGLAAGRERGQVFAGCLG